MLVFFYFFIFLSFFQNVCMTMYTLYTCLGQFSVRFLYTKPQCNFGDSYHLSFAVMCTAKYMQKILLN